MAVELQWQSVKFGEEHRCQVPSDQFGVYAFMLEPDLTGPPKSAYLLYVGKTERNFRVRFREYLPKKSKFTRIAIERMLEKWAGHIWFHYAAIKDKRLVHQTEQALLNACIPPFNAEFKGTVGEVVRAFRTGS